MAAAAVAQRSSNPHLGPNVLIFDPTKSEPQMQAAIDRVYANEQHSEFGPNRYALLFLPGKYHLNVPVGYYTEVFNSHFSCGCAPQIGQRTVSDLSATVISVCTAV